MTKHSEAKRALYPKSYGRSYAAAKPDYSRCAKDVWSNFGSSQCTRKCGYGPEGAYCKQHDPVTIKAKGDARQAKYRAEAAAQESQRAAVKAREAFRDECEAAILLAASDSYVIGVVQSERIVEAYNAALAAIKNPA